MHLRDLPAGALLFIWVGSELFLSLFKRSKRSADSRDRYSLQLIWLVNTVAFTLGIMSAYRLPAYHMLWPMVVQSGYFLFVAGLALRWCAILYLGRFFTTNVAIAADQTVINSGPYRWIRHPSYTGGLLAILGYCLVLQNWASLLIILLPSFAVQLWRIHVEEKALCDGLGAPYRNYMARTKRLIPFIY